MQLPSAERAKVVDLIDTDGITTMLNQVQAQLAKSGPGIAMYTAPYHLVAFFITQVMLAVLSALVTVIIAYGAVAVSIVGLLGPLFIPFLVFDKTEFLFWGWLRAYLSFSFYKVVAAATMSVLGQVYMRYSTNLVDLTDPKKLAQNLPMLLILVIVNVFLILKIPAMTASIFSGHVGGHDAGTGIASSIATRMKIADWRKEYNEIRPHSSLDYRTPKEFAATLKNMSYGKDS